MLCSFWKSFWILMFCVIKLSLYPHPPSKKRVNGKRKVRKLPLLSRIKMSVLQPPHKKEKDKLPDFFLPNPDLPRHSVCDQEIGPHNPTSLSIWKVPALKIQLDVSNYGLWPRRLQFLLCPWNKLGFCTRKSEYDLNCVCVSLSLCVAWRCCVAMCVKQS